jgi:hypothetical protein
MRTLDEAARGELRAALESSPVGVEALAFVEAVVEHAVHRLGRERSGVLAGATASMARRVVSFLEAATEGEPSRARAAEELAGEPAILAAFYQNLDLLPAAGFAPADAIALLVLTALALMEAIPPEA